MSDANRIADVIEFPFHPASHYDAPDDVLCDKRLSAAEKRVILSSWASDMYAVEGNPALREIPGIGHSLRLKDILAALRHLDEDDDPPPRGGVAMRVWRPTTVDADAFARPHLPNGRPARRRSWVAAGR